MAVSTAPPTTRERDYQVAAIDEARASLARHGSTVIVAPTGCGKCLGWGTPVLMADGSVLEVQDIEPGDQLMGPDSQPRNVLTTAIGYGDMHEVRPRNGDPWQCNSDHILTLQRTGSLSADDHSTLIDISVADYLRQSLTFRHTHKLVRAAVEWPERSLQLDPYFLGVLLGDGTIVRSRVAVTTLDPEIVAEIERQAKRWAMNVRRETRDGRVPTYYLSRGWSGGKPNPITEELRRLELAGCDSHAKFVPVAYRTASRQQRLDLLAGLMDTDGHLHGGVFDYVTASPHLAHDAAFMARSVGLRVHHSAKMTAGRVFQRLTISGDTSMIPTRIARKQAAPRRQKKDPLRTGFDIAPVGKDRYYGFELDGDGRFLLADFTITHNTVIGGGIARRGIAKGSTTLLLVHRRELVEQSIDTLGEACPDVQVGVIASGWPTTPWAPLQVASVQTLVRRESPLLFEPTIIIVDEAHHVRAKTWEKVLARYPGAALVGLTATPQRLDGKGLGQHFKSMVVGPSIERLATTVNPDTGLTYLAPTRTLTVPVGTLAQLRKNRNGEYRDDDLRASVNRQVVVDAADAYMRYAPGKRAIFFGIHRQHSRDVAGELRKRGIRAEHVDGDDHPSRRKAIMGGLRTGGIDVVCNVDLISEGFDAPACEAVVIGTKTASVTRFLQMCGRAMRPAPGKTALVLDLHGSCHELGLPDEPREWTLEDGEIGRKRSRERRPNVCDACATTFYGRRCPVCARELPITEVEHTAVDLEEARPVGPPKRTRRQNMAEVEAAFSAVDPLAELKRVRSEAGYKPGWEYRMLELGRRYGWDQ